MRRFKLGLVLALTVAVALPFVLAQVVENERQGDGDQIGRAHV